MFARQSHGGAAQLGAWGPPAQESLLVAPSASVVKPAWHEEQLGCGASAVPPADHVPAWHWLQGLPPKPGRQAAEQEQFHGVRGMRLRFSFSLTFRRSRLSDLAVCFFVRACLHAQDQASQQS